MSAPTPLRQAISTRAEAESLLARIGDSMVALVRIFEEETRLVKAGKLSEAGALVPEKTALASQYLREIETLKANASFINHAVPTLAQELRKAHAAFRDIITLNMRVVQTAQSVAEGIIRGAAGEAARRDAPKGYAADGRMTAAPASRPVLLNRAS